MLKDKIDKVKKDIEHVLKNYNPYLALSFGKDSTLLLWLIRQIKPDMPCLYRYYDEELPEIKEFREYIIKKWNINLTIVKNDNYKDFKPHHELTYSQSQNRIFEVEKETTTRKAKELGFDCVILGMRADESISRTWNFKKRGSLYFNNSLKIWTANPLCWWKIYEIQALIKYYNIPYSDLYNKTDVFTGNRLRSTDYSFTSMCHLGQLIQYKRYNPELYLKLIKEFPELQQHG